jgi:hypothetical protein
MNQARDGEQKQLAGRLQEYQAPEAGSRAATWGPKHCFLPQQCLPTGNRQGQQLPLETLQSTCKQFRLLGRAVTRPQGLS